MQLKQCGICIISISADSEQLQPSN